MTEWSSAQTFLMLREPGRTGILDLVAGHSLEEQAPLFVSCVFLPKADRTPDTTDPQKIKTNHM